MGRLFAICCLTLPIWLPGCIGTPIAEDDAGRKPIGPGEPHQGGQSSDPGGDAMGDAIVTIGGTGAEALGNMLQEVAIFFGADRKPGYALREIRDVHDLKDWSYRLEVTGAVEKCRDALSDLMVSDYGGWDETGMVAVVVSTLAQRDSSALVRNDCMRVLAWFYDWVHPLAQAIPAGPLPAEEAVLSALKAMESILKKDAPFADPADRTVMVDAVSVLGSYPWSELAIPDPKLARNRVAQPRGVVRALAGRPFREGREFPMVADTLDRALIRVTDQVLSMSLLGGLCDPAAHVRAAAAKVLGDRRVAEAVPVLARAIGEEREPSVRIGWIAVLGELGEATEESKALAIPALAGLLGDANDSVRRSAAVKLAILTGENPGPDVTDWQRWWRERKPDPGEQ